MTRILLRAGKSPFKPVSSHDTLESNLIGNNNGNLIFASAAHKLLSADSVTIDTRMYGWSAELASRVNSEYDSVVLPLANAFRPAFEGQLIKLTEFITRLSIPAVMLSGGAQSSNGSFAHLRPMENSIKNFCKAILARSSHITVRGEKTAEYIRSLGFKDVLVIGCPSMTMNGPGHSVRSISPKRNYNIAYNIENLKDILGAVIDKADKEHSSTYFPQDIYTQELMLWGVNRFKNNRDYRLPLNPNHEQFVRNKAEFHLDAYTWIEALKKFDFSFGPRIHGNIVSILAGTPAVVFAHDSRTQELSEYHEIPHFTPAEVDSISEIDSIVERADFSKFNAGHAKRFEVVRDFLDGNGLKTIYDVDQMDSLIKYESRMKETNFPEPQKVEWADMTVGEKSRLQLQRQQMKELATLQAENKKLKSVLSKLGTTLGQL